MNEEQIKELAEVTARSKSNTHRIDKLEEQNELMHEMNKNIALIADKTINTDKKVGVLQDDMEEIKSKPNKLVDKVMITIITGVVSAIIGAYITLILK